MDTVYILQVVTICITALTLGINVLVTLITNKQKNYNEIITLNRIEFMLRNRDNAAKFIAEAKDITLKLKRKDSSFDVKNLYVAFEQLCLVLKPYNSIDKEIITAGNNVIASIEQSLTGGRLDDSLPEAINEFAKLFNIYDDADWKFIKQQFNSTSKNSDDFDKICNEIKSRYL